MGWAGGRAPCGSQHPATRTPLQATARSETAAKGRQQGDAERVAVRDPVGLEGEREPLDEGLERQQRSGEPRRTRLALACRRDSPPGARMRPERELALVAEAAEQRAPARASPDQGAVAERSRRRRLHGSGKPRLGGEAL